MMRGRSTRTVVGLTLLVFGILALSSCAPRQANRAPLASFTMAPDGQYRPLNVAFDASGSTDLDGDSLIYAWSFGDGAGGTGARTTHTYESAGKFDVVLRVTDPEGLQDTAVAAVEILAVPEGGILLRFAWTWEDEVQRLDFVVSWNLYQTYRGRLRVPLVDNYEYADFVDDPLDEPTLEDLADLLWARASGDEIAYAKYALAFVQGVIAYEPDPPTLEWPFYPLETLVDRKGDCEDTAILYVSLLKAPGVPCQLAFVDTDGDASPDHVLALVEVPSSFTNSGATVLELDGTLYAVAETASGTMALGTDPWGLEVGDLVVLWPF